MKRLDRFILKSFVGPFAAILLIVIFILMMQFLWVYIDELVGKGLGLGVILEFLWWGCCISMPLALPLATLLAAMMTMGQLAENNELIAMKSAGVSLARIMTPVMLACTVISVGAFYVSDDLVPLAYNKIFTLRDDIGRTKDEIKIPPGTFYDGIDGYFLRVDDRDEKTGIMHRIIVYDHTDNKANTNIIIADSAMMKLSKTKDYLTFTLFNGVNYKENNSMRYRDTTLELQRVSFERQDLIIRLANYAFEQSDTMKFSDQVKSMNMVQLKHEQDSLRKVDDDTHGNHMRLFQNSSYLLKNKQLDSSFIALGLPDFECDNFGKWDNLTLKIDAYKRAQGKATQMSSELLNFDREVYNCHFILRRADLEILKKYSGALACLILFFIGAPLGALIRKGGLGVSAIVSAMFFVIYWVVGISGEKLAKDGAVSASTGAFISAYVLAPIGAFLCWKAINDSSIMDTDNLKAWWRGLLSRITRLFRKTRIVYMGTPEFAVAPLDALIKRGYKVVGVVTVADKPSGRGLKVNESPVKQYAVSHGIPVLQPLKLKDPGFLKDLAEWKADLFVVVAFRMLPEEVWQMPRLGTFNLHAALLPQYRGAAPINWAVINGENITGVTTFMIDKDIDTGGILLRQEHRIGENDTAGDVHDSLMEIGTELVVETVEGIIQKNIDIRVQRSFIQGSEILKPAPKLTRELCHIDWTDTTVHIFNLIRGLSPFPAAFTELIGTDGHILQMKIFAAEKSDRKMDPGAIASDNKNWLAIGTSDGAIMVKELQLAGKKRMDIKSFLLGFRDPESYKTTQGTSKDKCCAI